MLTLKDHVAGNAEFQYYRAGNLFYRTSTGLGFTIPVDETDGASFGATVKGLTLMKWIRRQLSLNENIGSVVLPSSTRKLIEESII